MAFEIVRRRPPTRALHFGAALLLSFGPGCAHQPRGAAADYTIGGTITYRERVALPPDAVVEVRLSDVSRQDTAAPVMAETTILPAGAQVPFSFDLRYDPEKIQPEHTYAVRATIRSGGQLRFTTTTAHHVITRGNPKHVDLVLASVAGAGGTSSPR
jgi:putative lipoprotein